MAWFNKPRKSFLLKAFVVGACAPPVWVCIMLALKDVSISWGHSQVLGWLLYSVYFVTFPTQIVFLDVERLMDALYLSLFAAPFNGVWYVVVASQFLLVRDAIHRIKERATNGHTTAIS
jgi:hypothetical protein